MLSSSEQIADQIIQLYQVHGAEDYIGEPVSQLEHMSQSAQWAQREAYDDEVILAAFFHDIGHLLDAQSHERMGEFGVVSHEKIGANYLRGKGFSERVGRLVENHVQAKRYLTFQSPTYFAQLSEASRRTLEFQGGQMTREEAIVFEKDDLFDLSIRMRQWDEWAKEENIPLVSLEMIRQMIIIHLNQHLL